MLSICIASKNRSRLKTRDGLKLEPLINCIKSIKKSLKFFYEDVEIIIADYSTDDKPQEWISEILEDTPHKVISVSGEFSRGEARNIAFRHSSGEFIFFLDADMIIYSCFILRKCVEISKQDISNLGTAYFPICYSYYNHQKKDGWWRTTGFGNVAMSRKLMNKVGEWQEKKTWGGEDDEMYMRVSRVAPVVREKVSQFYHQWHPYESEDIKTSWYDYLLNKVKRGFKL